MESIDKLLSLLEKEHPLDPKNMVRLVSESGKFFTGHYQNILSRLENPSTTCAPHVILGNDTKQAHAFTMGDYDGLEPEDVNPYFLDELPELRLTKEGNTYRIGDETITHGQILEPNSFRDIDLNKLDPDTLLGKIVRLTFEGQDLYGVGYIVGYENNHPDDNQDRFPLLTSCFLISPTNDSMPLHLPHICPPMLDDEMVLYSPKINRFSTTKDSKLVSVEYRETPIERIELY